MATPPSLQLAWLDANIYSQENQNLLKQIREISPDAMVFIDKDECLRSLGRGVANTRRFIFIVSGKLSEGLVPDMQEQQNIVSIYVYCGWRKRYEELFNQHRKVSLQLFSLLFLRLLSK